MDRGSFPSATSQSPPPHSTSPDHLFEDSSPAQHLGARQEGRVFEGPDPWTLPGPAPSSRSLPSTVCDFDPNDDDSLELSQDFFPFLKLPAEMRNRIYRYSLVFEKPFTVKFRSGPFDTGLLMVCKQIYAEAEPIFYKENAFRFPQAVFAVARSERNLENLFCIPNSRLVAMKNLHLEIPVGGHNGNENLKLWTKTNSMRMAGYLTHHLSSGTEIHVEFNLPQYEYNDLRMNVNNTYVFFTGWIYHRDLLKSQCDIHITVHIHPVFLADWINYMAPFFGHRVTLIARGIPFFDNRAATHFRQTTVQGFRLHNEAVIKSHYTECWDGMRYVISPKWRVP